MATVAVNKIGPQAVICEGDFTDHRTLHDRYILSDQGELIWSAELLDLFPALEGDGFILGWGSE